MRTNQRALGLLTITALGCVELRYADAGLDGRTVDATDLGPADAPRSDLVEVTDAPVDRPADALDAGDAADASDALDVADVRDVSDASDALDVTDVRDVSDASDALDVADVRDVLDAMDALDVTDVTDATDARIIDAPTDTLSRPDAQSDVPPDVTCPPNHLNCEGTCSIFCATPRPAPSQRSCAVEGTPGCGMAFIGAGSFQLGGDEFAANSTPAQPGIWVRQFYIDRYEVTVARFRAFAATRPTFSSLTGTAHYNRGDTTYDLPFAVAAPYEPTFTSANPECNWSRDPAARESHPMNCVTWSLAQAFCVWDAGGSDGRLPTEAEWEWVARGAPIGSLTTGRAYPWGTDSVDCSQANTLDCVRGTAPVGSTVAPYGVYDLIGNVYEWTADMFASFSASTYWSEMAQVNPLNLSSTTTTPGRVTRGGGWLQMPIRGAARNSSPENGNVAGTTGYSSVGFRCVHGRF